MFLLQAAPKPGLWFVVLTSCLSTLKLLKQLFF